MTAAFSRTVVFRDAQVSDLEALVALSRRCLGSDAWQREAILEELERNWATRRVAERADGLLLCYLVAWKVADEVSLLQIGTAPGWRGLGLARGLLNDAVVRWTKEGARVVLVEVRADSSVARAFYRRLGFEELGLRRGYYSEPVDDAVLMTLAL